MPATPTSRTASRSSPSPLVSRPRGLRGSAARVNWHLTQIAELELDEEGTRISLTIVDTPGFGDQIDNEAR